MRQPVLLAVLTALALASGSAAADSPISGHTISCSVAGNPIFGGCFYEVPLAVLGPLSFSVGVDAQLATPQSGRESYLAPYVLAVLSFDKGSVWGEFAAPDTWGIPVIGRSSAWRAGFTWTVPP